MLKLENASRKRNRDRLDLRQIESGSIGINISIYDTWEGHYNDLEYWIDSHEDLNRLINALSQMKTNLK
jgi:hypothetical protein